MKKTTTLPSATNEPKRRRLSPDERRREFIRKAIELFSEEGFDGGTRELARKLGVTQPLLYRYFPSKEVLINEVYRAVYIDRWDPGWDSLLRDRSLPIRPRLEKFYRLYTDAIFTREWMRIYLFSGLKGLELNRWYVAMVQDRILVRIIEEYRFEAGLPAQERPAPAELELAWVLHSGIFYYGVRKYIYESPVHEDKDRVIATALDVFLEGISRVFGTNVKVRAAYARPSTGAFSR
jgi:AcrR family transcriptional regulator